VAAPEPEPRRWWPWALLAALLVAGAVLALVLLTGDPERVRVPEVVGAQLASAQDRLEREGFEVRVSRTASDEERGEVIGQRPRGGRLAEEGSTVRLTVSDGPRLVAVPDVVGDTRRAARAALRDRGLEFEERRERSEDVPEGRVIETNPTAGQQVPSGSSVTLVLSSGPPPVPVPGVVGQPVDEARAALQAAGFASTAQEEASEDAAPGTVLRQSPAAGVEAEPGSTVTLVVATEPPEVEVPDVVGDSLDEARSELEEAGFEVETDERTIDDPDRDDEVVEQRPRAGRDAEPGSTVTIVIGRYEEPDPTTPEGGAPAPDEGGEAPAP
jgi:serine/threonine-protein kinase